MEKLKYNKISDHQICIIVPYFGVFPVWFDLYLYSCSVQNNIDFIFFTDCEIPEVVYDNTIFISVSFDDYCAYISEKLNIKFNPASPYKLCDVKPFYGVIHETIINQYTFWGFADIDLLFGHLEMVVNKDNLGKYDVITTHTNRIAGHFTIVRTNTKYTKICLQIPNWKEKLICQNHLSVDEDDWVLLVFPMVKWLRRLYRFVFQPLHIPMKYCYEGILNRILCNRITRISFREYKTTPIPSDKQTWIYDLSKVEVLNPEGCQIPYLHFLFFKKTPYKNLKQFWDTDFYKINPGFSYRGIVRINNKGIFVEND